MRAALVSLLVLPVFAGEGLRLPMKPRFEDSAMYRWLQKPVLETRLLDDMENPSTWAHSGFGEMTFTREHAIDGQQSLRLQGKLELTSGYNSESIGATRPFPGEDWSKFNRLSFWVYPNLPGFHSISMQVSLHNDGTFFIPSDAERTFPACMGSATLTGRECTATSASSSTVGGTTRGTFRKCWSTPARLYTSC